MKKISFTLIFLFTFALVYSINFIKKESVVPASQNFESSKENKPSTENMSEDIKKIIDRGILKVGLYKEDREGFFEEKNEELQGIDIDIAKKISEFLKVDLEFNREAKTYDSLVDLFISEKVDIVVSTFSDTPARSMYISFSDPYLELRTGIMINKQALVTDNTENNLVSYLKSTNKKICVQKGSSYLKIAKDIFPKASFLEVNEIKEALEFTKDAQVFGTFCSEIELIEHSIKSPILSVYTKPFVFSDIKDRFCIGVSKKSPELKNFINECLKYFKKVSVEDVEKKYKEIFKNKSWSTE